MKVAIIGAGVSGLAAGCLLARRGVEVAVFEANRKAGGCCATTTIDGYTFHDGAVYVAAPRIIDHGFAALGLDRASLVPLRRIPSMFRVTLPDGAVVTLGDGLGVTIEGGSVNQAEVQTGLRRMLRKWEPVLEMATTRLATEPFSPWRVLRYAWPHLHKFRGTLASELRSMMPDARIRAALAGGLLHTGAAPDAMPVAQIVGLVSILTEGLFMPEGGMGAISDALVSALRTHGGEFRPCSAVSRILVEGGRARGVQIAGHEKVEAAAVISTVSPMATFTSLVDAANVPASITRRIDRARLSHRAVSLQFGVARRIEARAMMNMVLPMIESQAEVLAQDAHAIKWPVYSVPTLSAPELAPAGGSIVEMFVPVGTRTSLETWEQEDRQALVQSAIDALGCFNEREVAVTRVRTPADFRDEMHLYDGALYGLSPTVAPQELFGQRAPIPGLLLAGQSTFPGYGVGAAIMSGIFAAEAVLADNGA